MGVALYHTQSPEMVAAPDVCVMFILSQFLPFILFTIFHSPAFALVIINNPSCLECLWATRSSLLWGINLIIVFRHTASLICE